MSERVWGVLARLNYVDVGAIVIFVIFWVWILHKNKQQDDTYDLADNLKDPYTRKASLFALIALSFAGVSAWWVVRSATSGGDPSNLLLGVLGIYIGKQGVDNAISAWGRRPPDPAPTPCDTGAAPASDASIQSFTVIKENR